jgi:alpha-tubulin suppressor-like RCC1 family protein/putative cell wall-binding protein
MKYKLLGVLLSIILILYGTVVPASAETVNETNATISRLAGQDHYQTSVAIAGAYNNNGDCGNVILASGDGFPDALSASILSKKLNAPILLVGPFVNDSSDAFNYISTNVSNPGTVYIMGETGVIGSNFETKLISMGYSNIKRLGGTDRYDTNMLIVNDVDVPQGTPVFIASGENFPDALSIASFSGSKQYPTLLVGANYLSEQTKNYLISDKPSAVYITGGTSVVSQDLENQIKTLVPDSKVTRLAGNDRYGTNAAVLNEFSPDPGTIYVADGDDFQDVLSGSALAAKKGDPIVLVNNQLTNLPSEIETYLKTLNSSGVRPNVIALGGTDVVLDTLVQKVKNSLDRKLTTVSTRIAYGLAAYYLDSSGHVWAWGIGGGLGGEGVLGNGTLNDSDIPVQVSNQSNVVSIAGGGGNGYALDSLGHVWAWGDGSALGNGTMGDAYDNGQLMGSYASTKPVQVSNLSNIVMISGGSFDGYALDSFGHVWAWGNGESGQLGNGTQTDSPQLTPVQVSNLTNIIEIAGGVSTGYALDNSGHVWAWGCGGNGELGNGKDNDSDVPVQVSNLSHIASIAAGGHNGYAIDSSGHVWAWGDGEFGLQNSGTNSNALTPVQISKLTNVIAISGGQTIAYALDNSGHVWAWGRLITDIEISPPQFSFNSNPIQITGLSHIVAIAGGDGDGYALDSSGQVWAWGCGNRGELGNGTTNNSNVPVKVIGLPK